MSRILFVGTHDRFRSKFACLYFNALCTEKGIRTRAFSAGFDISLDNRKLKKSNHALEYLGSMGLLIEEDDIIPTQLNQVYLDACDKVICMNMEEHLTMMRKHFPEQVKKSIYWHFSDEFAKPPESTLPLLRKEVDHFLAGLEVIA